MGGKLSFKNGPKSWLQENTDKISFSHIKYWLHLLLLVMEMEKNKHLLKLDTLILTIHLEVSLPKVPLSVWKWNTEPHTIVLLFDGQTMHSNLLYVWPFGPCECSVCTREVFIFNMNVLFYSHFFHRLKLTYNIRTIFWFSWFEWFCNSNFDE